MYVHFKCSACGKHIEIDQKGAGKQVHCPDCSALNEVPYAREQKTCPHCRYSVLVSYTLNGTEIVCSNCDKPYLIQGSSMASPSPASVKRLTTINHNQHHSESINWVRPVLKPLAWGLIVVGCVLYVVMGNSESASDSNSWVIWPIILIIMGLVSAITKLILPHSEEPRQQSGVSNNAQYAPGVNIRSSYISETKSTLNDGGNYIAKWGTRIVFLGLAIIVATIVADSYSPKQNQHTVQATANSGGSPIAKREQVSAPAQHDQQSPNAPMPDDQYYDYLKSKYAYESDMAVRVGLMRKYLNAYSQGRHIGEAMALLEKAESDLANWNKEQSQGGVLVECKAQLGSGQTALVQGYIQLFESATPLGDLISVADSQVSENAKALGEDTYVCAFGKNLRALLSSQRLIAQANINNGQVVFRGLPANKVLIVYGSGMAGMNFVGYCDSFMSVGGRTLTIQPDSLTHYCKPDGYDDNLTAKVLLYDWRPVGRE